MQTPEFWWAVGIGSISLAAIAVVYIISIALNQRRFIAGQRRQLEIIQESERKYRNLFENSQVGIVRISVDDFKVHDCNATSLRMFGKETDTGIEMLLTSSLSEEDRRMFAAHLRKGEPVENFQRRVSVDSAKPLWVSFSFRMFPGTEFAEGILVDITEGKTAEEQLLASHQQLRNLSAHLQSVREEERVRIAREIHDELGQVLTVAKLYLSVLLDGVVSGKSTSGEAISKSLESITNIVDDSITLVKGIAYQLRPMILDELGLKEALEWECAEFQKRTGIACRMRSGDELELGREESAAVFRILQEALTNVARHAKASEVDVEVTTIGRMLSLHVRDNGRGIPAGDRQKPRSLGIVGMKERAIFLGGRLKVTSGTNGGAEVVLEVPIKGDR